MTKPSLELGAQFSAPMPYPDPFSHEERCVIEEALRVGLERCFKRYPSLRQSPLDEVRLNAALDGELNSMMEDVSEPVPGFTSEVFNLIDRGRELCDHTGQLLEERPDLVLRRRKAPRNGMDPRYYALFIECKVVDRDRTMKRYVPEGLARFVDGDYAWAVTAALMVAYVDGDGYRLPGTLEGYLRKHATQSLKSDVALRDQPPAPAIYSTTHARSFAYRQGGGPGPIRVDHLWQRVR